MRRRRPFPVPVLPILGLGLAIGQAGCTVEPPPAEMPPPVVSGTATTPPPAAPSTVAGPEAAGDPSKETGPPPLLAAKPAQKVDVEALLLRANRALETGNLPNAVRGFEEVLKHEPENRRALSALAQSAQRFAMDLGRPQSSPLYLKSAEALRRLRKVDPKLTTEEQTLLGVALYNEACTLAVGGDATKALDTLREAFERGFARIDLIDTDVELDALRTLPGFKTLQEELEARHIDNLLASFQPFAFDFKLAGLDGTPVALADLRGPLTIVDFWGTWCLPCRKEIPHLVDLAARYKDRGLRVVGINYEKEEGDAARDAIRSFVKEYQIDYPCVLGDQPTMERVPGFEGYPTTLFLGPDGKVRLKLSGYQSRLALETAVKKLLPDAPAPTPAKAAEK